jgi:hypothetical protein
MNKFFRALIAGYGAKKLGGGCFSTILIFILIWVALGQCENRSYGHRHHAPGKSIDQSKHDNHTLAENQITGAIIAR